MPSKNLQLKIKFKSINSNFLLPMPYKINDLDKIMKQIYTRVPPSNKSEYKLLNSIRKILEENTEIVDNKQKELKQEELESKYLDLSFSRKEIPSQLEVEYKELSEKIKTIIKNRDNTCYTSTLEQENKENDELKTAMLTLGLDYENINREHLAIIDKLERINNSRISYSNKKISRFFNSLND